MPWRYVCVSSSSGPTGGYVADQRARDQEFHLTVRMSAQHLRSTAF
jgi:hypothetical protein